MKTKLVLIRQFFYLAMTKGPAFAMKKTRDYLFGGNNSAGGSLYERWRLLSPIKVQKHQTPFGPASNKVQFTVILTVLNEAQTIARFFDSILMQSAPPAELIIVDGGSTDNTLELVEEFKGKAKFPVLVRESSGASIAEGRNLAISLAKNENLILVDAGCILKQDYFLTLSAAAHMYPDADLIAGTYTGDKGSKFAHHFVPDWALFDHETFLPSARSCLIKKTKALEVGGFPVFLPKTGEDTLFDVCYRRASKEWVICPRAQVYWQGPATLEQAIALAESYGYGDGLSGYGDHKFSENWYLWDKDESKLSKGNPYEAYVAGYLKGRADRFDNEISSKRFENLVVILSLVPITDSGGGQRATQLAIEYSNQGSKVLFATVNNSYERDQAIYLNVDPTTIELYSGNDHSQHILDAIGFYAKSNREVLVIVEAPHAHYVTLASEIKKLYRDSRVIFDYIDNWESQLGGAWYSEALLAQMCSISDGLVASSHLLAEELRKLSDRQVHIAPNALNSALVATTNFKVPKDLPIGFTKTALYVGALWGDWFDWELLINCAKQFPTWAFVLIGEAPEVRIELTEKEVSNVFFLGLKPQAELPSYILNSDVCLIPFTVDEITKYVNPLKVYEYLAFGKKVVSMYMPDLVGLPDVYIAKTTDDFANLLSQNDPVSPLTPAIIRETHSWTNRVEVINQAARFAQ